MKSLLLLALVLCVAATGSTKNYIVVFHKNITEAQRLGHIDRLHTNVYANYSIGQDFKALAARMNPSQLSATIATGHVDYIEEDSVVHISQTCTVQKKATWGLNRISEREVFLSGDYKHSHSGAGITAFVVDTGILITHKEFTGRITWGANYVGDGINNDCNGHGTHVAGTVGGTTYGVAKKVTLVAVKVLGCSGSGTNAGVIQGIQFVANSKARPAVANMSLGGAYSKASNDAVAAAVKAGVTFAVAAGNDNADACNYSPASEASAISVGATEVDDLDLSNQFDTRSYFSNYGKCVHIFAPGTLITSAWITSTTATNTISGTSMASPHVCGAAALYLEKNPSATPAQVKAGLIADASAKMIDLNCGNAACNASPNVLLHSSC